MEYVSMIITLTVITGVISLGTAGFRLSGAVKCLSALLMITAVILPLAELLDKFSVDLDGALYNEESSEVVSPEVIYVDKIKAEIEKRLETELCSKLEEAEFSVKLAVDASDTSAVVITSVTVYSDSNNTEQIKQIVSENTGCENVMIVTTGGDKYP